MIFPISFYIYGALALLAIVGFGYGKYQHDSFENYKIKSEAIAKAKIIENESKAKQQVLINKGAQNDFKNKSNTIDVYYDGLRQPSSGSMSSIPTTPFQFNGSTKDALSIAKDCAIETQKLLSLQQWINDISETK